MCPCYWLFCTAVEGGKGQDGRQAVDQRPHEFVCVVWQRGRISKSSDSSHPVSGPSWADVLPSEGASSGVFFLVGIHEPEGEEVMWLMLPPSTLASKARPAHTHSLSTKLLEHQDHQSSWCPKRHFCFWKISICHNESLELSSKSWGSCCWVLDLHQLSSNLPDGTKPVRLRSVFGWFHSHTPLSFYLCEDFDERDVLPKPN